MRVFEEFRWRFQVSLRRRWEAVEQLRQQGLRRRGRRLRATELGLFLGGCGVSALSRSP